MESKKQCRIIEDWNDLLSSFPIDKKDVYFTKKYVDLYETPKDKALCVVCTEGDKIMLMPYLRGEIRGYYDFETAYGYGGPISNCNDSEWNYNAHDSIFDCLKSNNYVCGFSRFHPLCSNEKLVREDKTTRSIQVIFDRQTVAIDTSQSPEEIWMNQISSKNRNMIRKAEKNGLEFSAEYDYASYEDFIELYRSTMRRLSADDFYFFNNEYFADLKNALSGNSFLGTIRKDGKLICAAILCIQTCMVIIILKVVTVNIPVWVQTITYCGKQLVRCILLACLNFIWEGVQVPPLKIPY